MDTLPEELIGTIIQYVEDQESIKSCALTATLFREPSQRILWHIWRFGGDGDDANAYQTLYSMFDESPHLSQYIRIATFCLPPPDRVLSQIDYLQPLLAKFTHLRHFLLASDEGQIEWRDLSPRISEALVVFLASQTLEALHICSIDHFPLDLMALTLSASATVGFIDVSVGEDPHMIDAQRPMCVENLILSENSRDVAEALIRPQFASCISRLRRLWIRIEWEQELSGILASAGSQLEEICFASSDRTLDLKLFPALPALRFARIQLHLAAPYQRSWLVDAMRALLASPAVEVITIEISDPTIGRLLIALDALAPLLRTGFAPVLQWELDVEDYHDDAGARLVDEFRERVASTLPEMYRVGRVVVRQAEGSDHGLFWPGGTVIMAPRLPSYLD
ncbi:hypothetical protein FB45DRAFT_1082115 [Roridomyces roridus]|uniref:F-box domain-containing protein n=1 Tax=Roridomyces roridus TaxID=1738132 RepID=A0AAD7FLL0_9AGAR|nr:hypothetical protein FB45DRAFT_1082115 [Roridomyces roridus]